MVVWSLGETVSGKPAIYSTDGPRGVTYSGQGYDKPVALVDNDEDGILIVKAVNEYLERKENE